jgi:hypothetical protein
LRLLWGIFSLRRALQLTVVTFAVMLASCSGGGNGPTLPTAFQGSSADAIRTSLSTGFALGDYETVDSDRSIRSAIDQTATSLTHVAENMYYSDPTLSSKTKQSNTFLERPSLDAVQLAATEKPLPATVFYDFEHWSATPLSERQNPARSFAEGAQKVHADGLKFGVSPDMNYLGFSYLGGKQGCSFNLKSGLEESVDWSQIDQLNMQVQRPANAECSRNGDYSELAYDVSQIVNFVRAENPTIVISAEFSLEEEPPSQILAAAAAVHPYVNLVRIVYPAPCTYCTPANELAVLQGL